jgi:hypothetical protein
VSGCKQKFVFSFIHRVILLRTNDQLASDGTSTQGDLLNLKFSLKYPVDCGNDKCQNQMMEETHLHISTLYTTFSIAMSFTEGHTSIVKLSFCSFDGDELCRASNTGSQNNNGIGTDLSQDTCSDDEEVCSGYNEVCTSDTGMCQDDCLDDEDTCADNGEECLQDDVVCLN